MKPVRLPSTLFAVTLAAALMLPYSAPMVCELLGRMNGDMEIGAGTATVGVPDSGGMCCTIDDCGIPRAAPAPLDLQPPTQLRAIPVALPTPLTAQPANGLLPPIPPPQV